MEEKKLSPLKSTPTLTEEPVLEKKVVKKNHLKFWRLFFLCLTGLVLILLATGIYVYTFSKSIEPNIRSAMANSSEVVASFQKQDLTAAKASNLKLKEDLTQIQKKYQTLGFLNILPIANNYYRDGNSGVKAGLHGTDALDQLIKAVEPYSDLLGLKTDSKNLIEVKSIEDRIVFLVNTLDKIVPELDGVTQNLAMAKEELNKINPNRYPENFQGKNVRAKLIMVQQTVNDAHNLLTQARPLISLLPTLLGEPDPKMYMLLFQNDGELRPTGGFMTAYAFIKVHKGKIEPLGSYNIYDLDAKFGKKVPAPAPIKKYLNETNWNLRNMNISPDFKVSMDTFTQYVKDIPGFPKIDGIIALDTQVPVRLLNILGPIGVGGWGNFSAQNDKRCDCPQVVYALEDMITRPVGEIRTDRKAVLGPLMHSILANAMGSPKHLWPQFLNVGLEAIAQKHMIFYFFDEKNQKTAESFNAAGRIRDYAYDYLQIVDSNFGGAKSDLFIKREVEQEIEVQSDKVVKKVTITYNNPRKGSNCNLEAGQLCLNGVYRDWVRLLVPAGSKLMSVVGSETKEEVSEEANKTVFEGFFTMRPESSSKIVFTYELPKFETSPYRLLIQKQGGLDIVKHTIILNGKTTNIDLITDKEVFLD